MSASDPSAPGLPIAPGGGGVPTTRTVTAGTGLTGGGALSGDITIAASFGTTSGTVTQGNDSRVTGAAQKSANLSDIESASTARTNLGLGSLATASSVASTSISDSTATGRSLITATDAAAARTALSAVSTGRTIAGSDLTADISAATLRSSLSLPAAAPALSTSGRLIYLVADAISASDGGAVSSWTDSVSSRSAVQATGANQPLYYSGASGEGVNGRAVVRFDGTNDRLVIAGEAALDVTTLTIYIVARGRRDSGAALPASAMLAHRPYDLAASSPYSEWGFWVYNSTHLEMRADGTVFGPFTLSSHFDWGTSHLYVLTIGAGGTTLHIDGVRASSSATTSITYNTANLGIGLGGNAYTTPGSWWRGDMAAFALFSGAHTSAQRRANEGALCMYYGISLASSDT